MLPLVLLGLACLADASVLRFESHNASAVHGHIPSRIGSGQEWPPTFCNKLGCPKFEVVESKEGYELRKYEVSNWVSTEVTGVDYSKASYTLFMRLFNYISGQNADKKKIDMTCPVLMKIIPGPGAACESDFTMSFYMSEANEPTPDAKLKAKKDSKKAMMVYVRQFGGYAMSIDKWIEEAQKLGAAIGDQSKYVTDYWYTAGYDAPFKLFGRHNEIWFLAK